MAEVNVDLAPLEQEVSRMSEEDIRKQLVALRTKQRVNQSKHSNSESAKAYRIKRQEKFKLMTELAKSKGIYASILEEAKAAAEEQLADEELANTEA